VVIEAFGKTGGAFTMVMCRLLFLAVASAFAPGPLGHQQSDPDFRNRSVVSNRKKAP